MFRVISGILSLIVLAVFVVLAIGYLAPVQYEGELSEFFIDRRPIIWQALTNVENIPQAKPDVAKIEITGNDRGLLAWREDLDNGGYRTYRTVEKREPYKYVVNLFDSSDGTTGTWTFIIKQQGNGTIVTVSEESETERVWLRGWYTLLGRDVLLQQELKMVRVALFRRLINTP